MGCARTTSANIARCWQRGLVLGVDLGGCDGRKADVDCVLFAGRRCRWRPLRWRPASPPTPARPPSPSTIQLDIPHKRLVKIPLL